MDDFWIFSLFIAVVIIALSINYLRLSAYKSAWVRLAAETGLVCDGTSLFSYQVRASGKYRGLAVEIVGIQARPQHTVAKVLVSTPILLEIGIYPSDVAISAIRNFLGKKQFKIGDTVLDRRFAFFANDELLLQTWLASNVVRQWLTAIYDLDRLEIKNGWLEFQPLSISIDLAELLWMLDLVAGLAEEFGVRTP